ncbi:hypothetical protein OUZ56_031545 [Daphnia magna]|uniref:Uncharacterized protein n=2 Tax=Daphnia magna TaxID=35525 RepID=A0ABQ9ZUN9_9CRUS|nr:hypothetical protein OUZ56_031545 [Daphnia magna]
MTTPAFVTLPIKRRWPKKTKGKICPVDSSVKKCAQCIPGGASVVIVSRLCRNQTRALHLWLYQILLKIRDIHSKFNDNSENQVYVCKGLMIFELNLKNRRTKRGKSTNQYVYMPEELDQLDLAGLPEPKTKEQLDEIMRLSHDGLKDGHIHYLLC